MTNVENRNEAGNVRPYDFRRPQRLTGPLRDRLGTALGGVAEKVGFVLSDELNREIAVAFRESSEDVARVLLDAPADPVWALGPGGPGEGILCGMEASLAQAFVEMLLGGPGALRPVDRPPTAIETALLEKIALRLCGSLVPDGAPEGNAPAALLYLEGEAREERAAPAGVIGVFELALGEEKGAFRVFYTYEHLTALFGLDLGAAETASGGGSDQVTREHVGGVRIALHARLRSTPVRIGDITSLRVGDVLSLDRPITDPVEILIGGRAAYLGHPGRVDDRIGVQIAREA